MKRFNVGIECRKQGAIGVFEVRYRTIEVPDESAEPRNDAARIAAEAFRAEGWETRFPSTVSEITS